MKLRFMVLRMKCNGLRKVLANLGLLRIENKEHMI